MKLTELHRLVLVVVSDLQEQRPNPVTTLVIHRAVYFAADLLEIPPSFLPEPATYSVDVADTIHSLVRAGLLEEYFFLDDRGHTEPAFRLLPSGQSELSRAAHSQGRLGEWRARIRDSSPDAGIRRTA